MTAATLIGFGGIPVLILLDRSATGRILKSIKKHSAGKIFIRFSAGIYVRTLGCGIRT